MTEINIDDDLAEQIEQLAENYGYEDAGKYVEDVLYRHLDAEGVDASRYVSE